MPLYNEVFSENTRISKLAYFSVQLVKFINRTQTSNSCELTCPTAKTAVNK